MRLKRICSTEEKFEFMLSELENKLISRQYKPKIINEAFERIRKIPREEALKRVEKTQNEREVFPITFHPGMPSISKIVQKHHKVMISQSNILKRCFPKPSLVAYRRSKNLKDEVIRAKVNSKRRSNRTFKGYRACGQGCPICWHSPTATHHTCFKTKQTWAINSSLNCNSTNVVYKLMCKKDPEWVYIGETRRRLRDRIQEHIRNIKRNIGDIGNHFNLRGHSIADLVVVAIERVNHRNPKKRDGLRKVRESLWIDRYDAVEFGSNTRD